MDAPLFNQIVDLLIPYLQDSEERRALVEQALYGSPVLGQIRSGKRDPTCATPYHQL